MRFNFVTGPIFIYLRFMRIWFLFVLLVIAQIGVVQGQYQFQGKVNESLSDGQIFLSIVDNYRKISGVHDEQILNQTSADSLGNFFFSGNNLPEENRIYRIHVDTCSENEQRLNHFSGHCPNSREVLFIANNQDSISFPFSFEQEMFCKAESNHEKAVALLKIDSVKNDMKFAFSTYSSEANIALNTKKWVQTLQQFGKELNEPLAELYVYSYLSDQSNFLYPFYLEDLPSNEYYNNLKTRLEKTYPDAPYTAQYIEDLDADLYRTKSKISPWVWIIGSVVLLAFLLNFFIIGTWLRHKNKKDVSETLTPQELRIAKLMIENKSNKEIAQDLFISVSTVKTHINNIYKKLNVSSREELKDLNIS